MAWVIVGLGNPGEQYDGTRHNTGRMAVAYFGKRAGFSDFVEDKKSRSHTAGGMIGREVVALVLPDTFMNKSGASLSKFVKSVKAAEKLIVVYDDLDLPLGTMKLSFDRGSGGHKGLESVIRAVKTKKFTRVRIGVSPATPSGKIKKPSGEKEVLKFILDPFKAAEADELKKVFKRVAQALSAIVKDGPLVAMNEFN